MRSNVALRALLVLVPTLFAFGCADDAATPAAPAGGETAEEAELKGKPLATRVAACDQAFENAEDQSTAGMVEASGAWRTCLVKAVDAQKLAAKEIAATRATIGLVCQHKSAASTEAFGTLNRVESASCPGARELDVAYLLDNYGPKQSSTIAQTELSTDACQAAFDTETNGGDAPQQTMNQAIGAQNECYVQRAVDGIVQGLLDNVAQAKADGWEDSRFTETYAGDAATVRASVEADVRAYDQSLASVCRAALTASGEEGGTLGVFLVGACQAHVFKRYLPLAFALREAT